jgi:uncharacterized membrane protein
VLLFLVEYHYIIIIIQNNIAILFQNLWHLFQHVIEAKNHVIESLLKELDQSEEQYARNLQSHIEAIDNLIGMLVLFQIEVFFSAITSKSQDSTLK